MATGPTAIYLLAALVIIVHALDLATGLRMMLAYGMTPEDGIKPTTPQLAAGIRILPPPSVACAMGTMPAATAAAAPPLDPPALYSLFQGLRQTPR